MPQPMPNAPQILPRYGQTATRARLAGFSLLVLIVACETTVAPIRRHDLAASRSGAGIFAVNCAASSLPGVLTIPELGTGSYFGQQGGLYPGGTNTMPAAHLALGLGLISQVQPRWSVNSSRKVLRRLKGF